MQDFVQLGSIIKSELFNPSMEFQSKITLARHKNSWFEETFIKEHLRHWSELLRESELGKIIPSAVPKKPKKILVIGAGNIPLAAWHDVLCVLLSGHHLYLKLSRDDEVLIPMLLDMLTNINPVWKEKIFYVNTPMGSHRPDAVIASGSDSAEKVFREYFKGIPGIFRKSKTGLALLTGSEKQEELQKLGKDVFLYFGLGCRNVTTLLVPLGYPVHELAKTWEKEFAALLMQNKKYSNNYDYYKAMFMLGKIPFEDHGFFLAKEDGQYPFSPPSVLNVVRYRKLDEAMEIINSHREKLQVVVGGPKGIPFGFAQFPVINEFADAINTMDFLVNLND
ncbi:MAG: hypothetical protein N3F09_00755 [Bacteroidia bacterium]|nr:hypothetical protein [Bacteroidia bacterium]